MDKIQGILLTTIDPQSVVSNILKQNNRKVTLENRKSELQKELTIIDTELSNINKMETKKEDKCSNDCTNCSMTEHFKLLEEIDLSEIKIEDVLFDLWRVKEVIRMYRDKKIDSEVSIKTLTEMNL